MAMDGGVKDEYIEEQPQFTVVTLKQLWRWIEKDRRVPRWVCLTSGVRNKKKPLECQILVIVMEAKCIAKDCGLI